jgi:hypothetical protein
MFIDNSQIVNQDYYETVKDISTCIICTGVVVDPMQCTSCENCFCKGCINAWIKKSSTCPFKCAKSEYKEASRLVKNMMGKLVFKCPFEVCSSNVPYDELLQHDKKCSTIGETTKCPTCGTEVKKCNIDRKTNDELRTELEIVNKLLAELRAENDSLKQGNGNGGGNRRDDRTEDRDYRDKNGYDKGYEKGYGRGHDRGYDKRERKEFSPKREFNNESKSGRGGYKKHEERRFEKKEFNNDSRFSKESEGFNNDSRFSKDDRRGYGPKEHKEHHSYRNPYPKGDISQEKGLQESLVVSQPDNDLKPKDVPVNFPYTVYTENCSHYLSNKVMIFDCCNKAFPCRRCHKEKDSSHRLGKSTFIYCKLCYSVYSDHKNKCGSCGHHFYQKRFKKDKDDSDDEEQ